MARPGISGNDHGLKRVCVPERGYTDVEQDIWSALQSSADFRRLHAEGVLEVAYRPLGKVRLKGTCYVGHAICGEVLLECCEKVDGALTALLAFASHNAFRLAKAQAATSELGDLVVLLVAQFLETVTTYTSSGRRFQYTTKKAVGSLVGGRLDITKSIQLRARGLGHLLAFEKNVATFNIPINRVVLAALSEVERLARLVKMTERTIAKSRGLSMLFGDCRDHETLYRERSYFAIMASRLADTEGSELIRDMMSLASVLLWHESFDSSSGQSSGLPRTWFLNLEKLFETAVLNVLSDLCVDASVYRGGESPKAIFSSERAEYRANPDIVISSSSAQFIVGDVKYKIFDGSAAAGDVYQLLAHAEAFGALKAFLIFPGESYFFRDLGVSRGGISTAFFAVRVRHLREDLDKVAKYFGLNASQLTVATEFYQIDATEFAVTAESTTKGSNG